MQIIGWKIWYNDSSTFDSTQGPWEQAPAEGVIAVVEYFDEADPNTGIHYENLHQGADYYAFDGKHFSLREDDPESGNHSNKLKGPIKTGAWASDADYQAITDQAINDNGEGWLTKPSTDKEPPARPHLKAA